MAIARALRPVVDNLAKTFGRKACIVHRSAGEFDHETGKRATAKPRETVYGVLHKVNTYEHGVPGAAGSDGHATTRTFLFSAQAVTEPPSTSAKLHFEATGKPDEVWQIVQVETIEEAGLAVAYQLVIRR